MDSSLVFPVFGDIKWMPPPNFSLFHLNAPEAHHFFMNNLILGSKLINMGMHFAWLKIGESRDRINICPPCQTQIATSKSIAHKTKYGKMMHSVD